MVAEAVGVIGAVTSSVVVAQEDEALTAELVPVRQYWTTIKAWMKPN